MEANKGTQIGSAHLCGSLSIPYGLKVPVSFAVSDPLLIRTVIRLCLAAMSKRPRKHPYSSTHRDGEVFSLPSLKAKSRDSRVEIHVDEFGCVTADALCLALVRTG